ncbi:hypothetical protein bmyco0003_49680 [Bacillus pseudomycoides]|nr:hypothetical protein bmyco0003_49680 [Bacillus pseudomycoides]
MVPYRHHAKVDSYPYYKKCYSFCKNIEKGWRFFDYIDTNLS